MNQVNQMNQLSSEHRQSQISQSTMNTMTNCAPPADANSTIDDKYVVVVDSSCVSNGVDHNTSSQSLTVKNSPSKSATSTGGILTTDLDQCGQQKPVNSQPAEHLKVDPPLGSEHLNNKSDKCDEKIGLESPTTSSSESGRGTLNGEQQLGGNGHTNGLRPAENGSAFDQTSVTSEDMKRLKTFKEEVLENWNHNKKLIAANCIVVESRSTDANGYQNGKDDKQLNTFEQVQLKIQKLLNDDEAFTNDEDFDDLLASDAYQNYTAQAMNLSCLSGGKLDRLSVVNESDGSWLSDSTNANSVKNKPKTMSNVNNSSLNGGLNGGKQLGQSNPQLNLNTSQSNQSNHSLQGKQSTPKVEVLNKQPEQSPCVKRSTLTHSAVVHSSLNGQSTGQQPAPQQLPATSATNQKSEAPASASLLPEQSPRLHHLHAVHQSPKSLVKPGKAVGKLNAKPIGKLGGHQAAGKEPDFAALLSENSRRLSKLGKSAYKNRSMDDLTDLMDDLNSVVTEATMNYNAPTVVKKQLRGIESMYSEVGLLIFFFLFFWFFLFSSLVFTLLFSLLFFSILYLSLLFPAVPHDRCLLHLNCHFK